MHEASVGEEGSSSKKNDNRVREDAWLEITKVGLRTPIRAFYN